MSGFTILDQHLCSPMAVSQPLSISCPLPDSAWRWQRWDPGFLAQSPHSLCITLLDFKSFPHLVGLNHSHIFVDFNHFHISWAMPDADLMFQLEKIVLAGNPRLPSQCAGCAGQSKQDLCLHCPASLAASNDCRYHELDASGMGCLLRTRALLFPVTDGPPKIVWEQVGPNFVPSCLQVLGIFRMGTPSFSTNVGFNHCFLRGTTLPSREI